MQWFPSAIMIKCQSNNNESYEEKQPLQQTQSPFFQKTSVMKSLQLEAESTIELSRYDSFL